MLEGYNESVITDFFLSLPGSDRDKVNVYVADLTRYLFAIGRKFFPRAFVVADPYHFVRRIIDFLDAAAKPRETEMMAAYVGAIQDGVIARPLRAKRKAKTSAAVVGPEMERVPTFAEIKILLHTRVIHLDGSQKTAVNYLLDRFDDVRAGYVYLQAVMSLYHTPVSQEVASRTFDSLEQGLVESGWLRTDSRGELDGPFAGLVKLNRSCRDEICAYWACGWSNGETEAQNAVIAGIDRMARGLGIDELRRRWISGKSSTAILAARRKTGRSEGKVKTGPKKIRRTVEMPPPPEAPLYRPDIQPSLFDAT